MEISEIIFCWRKFFFFPQSAMPMSMFRIAFGLLVVVWLALLQEDLLVWLGSEGIISTDSSSKLCDSVIFSFLISNCTDSVVVIVYVSTFIAAIFLTCGYLSKLSAGVVYLGLTTLLFRDPLITPSCYVLFPLSAFYLMLSHCGDRLSIDRLKLKSTLKSGVRGPYLLIQFLRGSSESPISNHASRLPRSRSAPWAMRLFQLQIALIYLQSFWLHAGSPSWQDGTVFYYLFNVSELSHFHIPEFIKGSPSLLLCLSRFVVFVEFSMFTLVWIKEFRKTVLVLAVITQLFMDYAFNMPVYYWLMIASLLVFMEDSQLKKIKMIPK